MEKSLIDKVRDELAKYSGNELHLMRMWFFGYVQCLKDKNHISEKEYKDLRNIIKWFKFNETAKGMLL